MVANVCVEPGSTPAARFIRAFEAYPPRPRKLAAWAATSWRMVRRTLVTWVKTWIEWRSSECRGVVAAGNQARNAFHHMRLVLAVGDAEPVGIGG